MPKIQLEFCNNLCMRHTFWSYLIRCANMKWICLVLWEDTEQTWFWPHTDRQMDRWMDRNETSIPLSTSLKRVHKKRVLATDEKITGGWFNKKMSSYQYRKSHCGSGSYDRLISTMGFPIPVRRHLYIESGPWFPKHCHWAACHLVSVRTHVRKPIMFSCSVFKQRALM